MTVFGLPLHPLIVHATVVVVPTAAFAVLLATFWPRFRRWASWGPAAAAALAVVIWAHGSVPLAAAASGLVLVVSIVCAAREARS